MFSADPVTTSKTFAQLARLCGAAPGRAGPFVARHLRREDLATHLDRLALREGILLRHAEIGTTRYRRHSVAA